MKSSIYLLLTGMLLTLTATSQTPDYSKNIEGAFVDGASNFIPCTLIYFAGMLH